MPALASDFISDIPKYYDRYLRSLLFDDYAADLARRVRGALGAGAISARMQAIVFEAYRP